MRCTWTDAACLFTITPKPYPLSLLHGGDLKPCLAEDPLSFPAGPLPCQPGNASPGVSENYSLQIPMQASLQDLGRRSQKKNELGGNLERLRLAAVSRSGEPSSCYHTVGNSGTLQYQRNKHQRSRGLGPKKLLISSLRVSYLTATPIGILEFMYTQYIYMCTSTYRYIYILYLYLYLPTYVRMYVCMYVCLYV